MPLHSAIYRGRVWHHRHLPRVHKFRYSVFMMYVDLAEVDEVLSLSRLWSHRRWSVAQFRRTDYFAFPAEQSPGSKAVLADGAPDSVSNPGTAHSDAGDPAREPAPDPALEPALDIDQSVRAAVQAKLDWRPDGPIRLLTNFRYFGYLINPISCYYCFDANDRRLDALLIEVTNTPWGQRTHYVLDLRNVAPGSAIDFDKSMHVSPFMPMNMKYRWKGDVPDAKLVYSLASFYLGSDADDTARDKLVRQFDSGVNFDRVEINAASLNRVIWQFPWMTAKVATAIYWQALKLWLKRIPFVPHPDRISGAER